MTIRFSQRLAGAVLPLFILAAPVFAQQPRPAAPAPAAPAPQAPAAAQPQMPPGQTIVPIPQATAGHITAARELVLASGMKRSFLALIPDMMRQLNSTVTRTRPELINDMKTTLDGLEKEFLGYADDLVEPAARVYTALLNEQECKDAAAFFKSASGVKYADAQPSVFANMSQIMEAWSKQLSVKMYDRTREEMKKKGRDI